MISALGRIVVVCAGFALACLAGIATLVVAAPETGLFTLPPFSTELDVIARTFTIVGLLVDAPVVTAAALGLAAVAIGESARLRSWLYHVPAWGAAGAGAATASRWLWHAGTPPAIARDIIIAFVAAGFVAGFTYWLVAGRSV